jgi:hypothetical protein
VAGGKVYVGFQLDYDDAEKLKEAARSRGVGWTAFARSLLYRATQDFTRFDLDSLVRTERSVPPVQIRPDTNGDGWVSRKFSRISEEVPRRVSAHADTYRRLLLSPDTNDVDRAEIIKRLTDAGLPLALPEEDRV